MPDITASLWCEVHGEVTLHALLTGSRYECMEVLGSAGVCGETRDARTGDEDAYGQVYEHPSCPSCGCHQDARALAEPQPVCWYCHRPLPTPTAEEASS